MAARDNLCKLISDMVSKWPRGLVEEKYIAGYKVGSRNLSSDLILAKAVMAIIEDRAAVRIICSDDAPASDSPKTRSAMIDKHPPAPLDCHIPPRVTDSSVSALQVDEGDVRRAINSFPPGSSGGPDSLLPQHLNGLIGNDGDPDLLCSLTSFVNRLLEGTLPAPIAKFFYGGTLIAYVKQKRWWHSANYYWVYLETTCG